MHMQQIRADIIQAVHTLQREGLAHWKIEVSAQDATRAAIYVKDGDGCSTAQLFDTTWPHGQRPILRCSEYYTIRVVPKVSGFLTMFNLGTSGSIEKMYPLHNKRNEVYAGVELLVAYDPSFPVWEEGGPPTKTTGFFEGLLVVIVEQERPINVSDLHIDLIQYEKTAQARGDLGKESVGISFLYACDDVYIDLIEFEVI